MTKEQAKQIIAELLNKTNKTPAELASLKEAISVLASSFAIVG